MAWLPIGRRVLFIGRTWPQLAMLRNDVITQM
jgi:hypothetical protein